MEYIKVNIITEAPYGPSYLFYKGSGLVTAFKELINVLESLGVDIKLNSREACDLNHIHSSGPFAAYHAKKSKIPLIITAHTHPYESKYLYRLSSLGDIAYKKYLINLYNKADMLIAPTNFTKDMLEKIGVNKPIEVISNGVDVKKYQFNQKKRDAFRQKYKVKSDEILISSVGLMSSRKGVDKFIDIAKEMQEYKFVWSGKKSIFPVHRNSFTDRIIIKKAPSNFIKTGYVNDIVATHCAGDVFLFPSPFETQGIVALEAAACSRPLVVEDIPSFEWLGKSCFRAKTLDDYCNQIEKAIDYASNLQKRSRLLAKENNIIKTGKSMIKMYEHVLSA